MNNFTFYSPTLFAFGDGEEPALWSAVSAVRKSCWSTAAAP